MGNNFSDQLVKQTQTIVSQALTDVANNVDNSNYSNVRIWQSVDLDVTGADMNRCKVTIAQDGNLASEQFMQATTEVQNEVATRIQSDLATLVTQTLDQVNKSIPIGAVNRAKVESDIRQSVTNLIKTNIKTNINNLLYHTDQTQQNVKFRARYFKCRNSPISINQASIIDSMSSSTASNVITNIVKTESVAGIKADIDQKVKQANTGLDLSFIFILLILGLIAFLYFILKHNPVKAAVNAVKNAASTTVDTVASAASAVTNVPKSHMKPVLAITSFFGVVSSLVYGLMRTGKLNNPFAPDVAQ
jgi:hypothetical protein